jgi:hypothetical protein
VRELSISIREFIDAGATPITADEVMVVGPPPGSANRVPRSSWRSRRVGVYATVVVAVAAVSAVIGLSLSPTSIHTSVPPASAATFLDGVATTAAAQPPLTPHTEQFLFVRTLQGYTEGSPVEVTPRNTIVYYYEQSVIETWSSPTALGRTKITNVGFPRFVHGSDRRAWLAAGSPPLETGGEGGGPPPYYDVADLPTHATQIRAYLLKQPTATLPTFFPHGHDAAWEFNAALDYLGNGASSLQRAALLRFMAGIPGVRYEGRATTMGTDLTGRLISIASNTTGVAEQAIFDPKTSDLLEMRRVATTSTSFGSPLQPGQIRGYWDPLYQGISDSSRQVPKGAPPFPAPLWPYDTYRLPLPGSVYP